jgi:hypothetical protein
MSSPFDALFAMARQLEDAGAHTASARCLLAIVNSSASLSAPVAARARLALARLLIEHFHNLGDAKTQLLQAVRVDPL